MLIIIFLAIAVLMFAIGAFIRIKKVTWLISGYNTASREEKEKYDIDKLCYYVGNFIFILGAIWLAMTICLLIFPVKQDLMIYIGLGLESVAMIAGIIFLNTNNRVMK